MIFVDPLLIPGELARAPGHAPLVFDCTVPGDAEWMSHLVATGQAHTVHDDLERQLDELIRLRARGFPLSADELAARREQMLGGALPAEHGRWIFYPWSGRLVHVLGPDEFRELRLHRNRHRITAPEQERLAGFTVGVVGLAVGGAVALTLALEGGAAHLKLADAGEVKVGDLNHVAAGIHELGLPRAVAAARRIYELDPYASVSLHTGGLEGGEALDAFFDGAAPLDVVVDACDCLHLKLLLRERAAAHGIPVLMETSDRGTVDVERFDLEPGRAPFHGRLGAVGPADWAGLDDDRRAALAVALMGPDELSQRAGASLVDLRGTLAAWPRLGSDAALAGATLATAVRRLALGQPLPSGRRHVDVEAVLRGGQPEASPALAARAPVLRALAGVDGRIPELVRLAVEAGTLAPSKGNCQPWRFKWDGERLWVVHDRVRSASLLDAGGRASHVALGAALENIAVAAAHRGHRARTESFPRPHDPSVVAAVAFEPGGPGLEEDAALYPQVELRATNRKVGPRAPLTADHATALGDAARVRGARLDLLSGDEELAELARVVGEGERIRFLCRELHQEMVGRVRWTPDEAHRTGDGVPVEALELKPSELAAMRLAARPDVAACLRELDGAHGVRKVAERAIAGSSAVGLLTVGGGSPSAVLRGGRAVERVWLQATALGLSVHPVTGLVYLFDLLETSAGTIFTGRERSILRGLRERFDALFRAAGDGTRLMLFRLGQAAAPAVRTARRPVEDVLTYGRPALAA